MRPSATSGWTEGTGLGSPGCEGFVPLPSPMPSTSDAAAASAATQPTAPRCPSQAGRRRDTGAARRNAHADSIRAHISSRGAGGGRL